MQLQLMPPCVASGCYNSNVTPDVHDPISYVSHDQSNVPLAYMPPPSNYNHANHVNFLTASMQAPFADPPVARFEPLQAFTAELMNCAVQTRLQFAQQHFLRHPSAAAGQFLFPVAHMPLTAPQFIQPSGIHPRPVINPVFQQPLVQAQDKHQKQAMGEVNVSRQLGTNSCLKEPDVNCSGSWMTNAIIQDKIWTKPADMSCIWNNAADHPRDSNLSSFANTRQNLIASDITACDTLKSSVAGTDTVRQQGSCPAVADQLTTSTGILNPDLSDVAKAGFCSEQHVWPTTFGPFTRPPESSVESNLDTVCRLPPGLETHVLTRIGVIGQRSQQVQQTASVEGYDSGVDSVSSDIQGLASISELSVDASSSETSKSGSLSFGCLSSDAVEQQSILSSQEQHTVDDSVHSSSSLLMDIMSSKITQTVPRQRNMSDLPNCSSSRDEFSGLQHHPRSCDHLSPVNASENDSGVTSHAGGSTYSHVGNTFKQTVTASCDRRTSQPVPETVEQMLGTDNSPLLCNTISLLFDVLCSRQLTREELHSITDAMYDKLAATSEADCPSQIANLACTQSAVATASVVSSSTNTHASVDYHPLLGNANAANRQDECSSPGNETDVTMPVTMANVCRTSRRTVTSTTTSSPTNRTPVEYDDDSFMYVNTHTNNASSHNETSAVDEETGVSLPVTAANTHNAAAVTADVYDLLTDS